MSAIIIPFPAKKPAAPAASMALAHDDEAAMRCVRASIALEAARAEQIRLLEVLRAKLCELRTAILTMADDGGVYESQLAELQANVLVVKTRVQEIERIADNACNPPTFA